MGERCTLYETGLADLRLIFNEISRCRPDIQNKLFPIIHEGRVPVILLKGLRYRWAALNHLAPMMMTTGSLL